MRIQMTVPHQAAPIGSPTPQALTPEDIENLLLQLKPRKQNATQMVPRRRRTRSKPRRVFLFAALPVLAVGIAWTVYQAITPAPPAAPAVAPNATVSVMSTPAAVPSRQSLHREPVLRIQPKSAMEQARVLFHDDDKGFSLKFKTVNEIKFREPESYIVLFSNPIRKDQLSDWKSRGIVLVENYGPLVSVFWVPSEVALKNIGELSMQICPLNMTAKVADAKPAIPAEAEAKN